jgi:hypothetical protein
MMDGRMDGCVAPYSYHQIPKSVTTTSVRIRKARVKSGTVIFMMLLLQMNIALSQLPDPTPAPPLSQFEVAWTQRAQTACQQANTALKMNAVSEDAIHPSIHLLPL